MGDLFKACYFRGKELGYEDNHIHFEWPIKVAYNCDYRNKVYYPCPSHSILPIKFVENGSVNLNNYDIIDLTKPNSFYEGSIPLYIGNNKKTYAGHWNYLNKYYIEYKERPIFNIPKDKLEKPYILFHIRVANWSEYRNPDLNVFRKVIIMLKNTYSHKYNIWKCGEPCRGLDGYFDKTFEYFEELDDFLKLINNSSLFICSNSGPQTFGMMLGTPILELDSPKYGRRKGCGNFYSKEYWKNKDGIYGKTAVDWLDKSKIKTIFKGDDVKDDDILSFTEEILCQN